MNNPFIVAEVGINHTGDINIAKKLIDMAKECGADAVKFQKRTIDLAYTQDFLDSPRESPWGTTQREQKEGLEFDTKEYSEIDVHCLAVGIDWFASAWDLEAQEFLWGFNLKYNKIASKMLSNTELLKMVAKEGKYTFISSNGWMGDEEHELVKAVEIFRKYDCPFTVMHCVPLYPCPDNKCNLGIIPVLKARFNCPIGYSSHNYSVLPSSLAVLLGAEAIEIHVTLDRASYGSDQASSFERDGLRRICRDTRIVRSIVG